MVEKIKVSGIIQDEIEDNSKNNWEENKKTEGYLFGHYDPVDKSIIVESKHELRPVRDFPAGILEDLPNWLLKMEIHNKGIDFIKNLDGESCGVFYKSCKNDNNKCTNPNDEPGLHRDTTLDLFDHRGFITYSLDREKFRGYGGVKNEIPVETPNEEQKICYSGLNLREE